jgi:hypothetical protein
MQEFVNTLLFFVPAEYRPIAEALMAVLYALGGFLAVVRPLLAKVPAGPARRWLDAFDWLLHIAALNSRPTAHRPAPAPKRPSVP